MKKSLIYKQIRKYHTIETNSLISCSIKLIWHLQLQSANDTIAATCQKQNPQLVRVTGFVMAQYYDRTIFGKCQADL